MPTKLRIIFMGTPDFAVPALIALVEAGHEVACVYTQPPRPAGRGKQLQPSPVQREAEARGIPVRHPVSLKGADEQAEFAALNADVAIVAAYGLILPRSVLDAPRHGCINIHASLLPRWRGAAPIQPQPALNPRTSRNGHSSSTVSTSIACNPTSRSRSTYQAGSRNWCRNGTIGTKP